MADAAVGGGRSRGEDGRSRREDTYLALRGLLMSGDFTHGDQLVESRIGTLLGVSRTPVREALTRLESEGLVEHLPNGTKVVADLWRMVAEVLDIRVRLEPLAVRLAANRMTGEQLEEIGRLQDRMERILADEPAELEELLDLNQRFHWQLVLLCGNTSLINVLERLRPFSVFPRILAHYSAERLDTAIHEHRAILDALWRRDQDASERLTTEHLTRGAEEIKEVFATGPRLL